MFSIESHLPPQNDPFLWLSSFHLFIYFFRMTNSDHLPCAWPSALMEVQRWTELLFLLITSVHLITPVNTCFITSFFFMMSFWVHLQQWFYLPIVLKSYPFERELDCAILPFYDKSLACPQVPWQIVLLKWLHMLLAMCHLEPASISWGHVSPFGSGRACKCSGQNAMCFPSLSAKQLLPGPLGILFLGPRSQVVRKGKTIWSSYIKVFVTTHWRPRWHPVPTSRGVSEQESSWFPLLAFECPWLMPWEQRQDVFF